jgi:ferredoxin-type protein NapG
MDRRSFFRSAIDKGGNTVGKAVVKAADASVKKQASHWLRPPFALNELEFLLACTRCNDCIDACPHNVIFSLPARVGVRAAGTPALDLLNKGCHLCEDWPCVSACEVDALLIPDIAEDSAPESEAAKPKLAKVSIDENLCLPYSGPECGACIDSCPVDGALTLDMFKPVINEETCTGCALCREICFTEPKAITVSSL